MAARKQAKKATAKKATAKKAAPGKAAVKKAAVKKAAASTRATGGRGRATTPAAASTVVGGRRELVVITEPGAQVRARVGGVRAAAASAADAITAALGGATLVPLFGATEERAAAASASVPGAPDLSVFYTVDAPDAELDALARRLAAADGVAAAYVKPPAEPPLAPPVDHRVAAAPQGGDTPPATRSFVDRQFYLEAAPGGVDARYAWGRTGGRGAGVRVIDVEGAWRFSHEDLTANQGGVVGGTESTDLGWRNHGTAVVGVIGGDDNAYGVTGISPDANTRAISIFGAGQSSSKAIRDAADRLGPGDLLLIELHRPGPRNNFVLRPDQDGYIAVEWWEDDFAAIAYATAKGVIVVEAAGNGDEDFDDPIYAVRPPGFPASWTNPFNRGNRDSGAVLVGAGAPPPGTHGADHGPDRSRLGFSNYGASVDVQGIGREVTTTGYGDLQGGPNEDLWYTDVFSGTSSSSPIVVGVLACAQGALAAAARPLLTPATARQLLRTTGSPQQDAPGRPATQRIGNRPDLKAMFGQLFPKLKDVKDKEIKEKDLKDRIKDLKDKDRKEFKEIKEVKEKDWKDTKEKDKEKDRKEFKELKELKELKEKDAKEFKEKDKDREIDWERWRHIGVQQPDAAAAPDELEMRLAGLEAAVSELTHFIVAELRPDLSGGGS